MTTSTTSRTPPRPASTNFPPMRPSTEPAEPTSSVTSWIEDGIIFVLTWDWLDLTVDSAKEAVYAFRAGSHRKGIVSDVGDKQLACMVFEVTYDDDMHLDTVRYHVLLIDPNAALLSFS